MFERSVLSSLLIGVLFSGPFIDAHAQQPDERRTVADRFKSVHRADGVPVGAMRLYPRLGVGLAWSDNVFADNALESSDWASKLLTEARLESISSIFSAEIGGRAEITRFNDFSSNDFDNIRFWFSGNKDFRRGNFVLDADFADLAEPRTSVDAAGNATELTQYRRTSLESAYTYRPGLWTARLDGRYRRFDFDDSETLTGTIDNDDRNRKVFDMGIRFGYESSGVTGFFLEPRFTKVDYEQPVDNGGFERSSDGYEIRLGTSLNYSGLLTGEVFAGYLERNFDDIAFGNVQGPSFGAEIQWHLTDLTTVSLGASRTTDATTIAGASTTLNTRFMLGIAHELRRNLLLQFDLETAKEDFEGILREDDVLRLDLRAEYRVNRRFWLQAGYQFSERRRSPSNTGGRNFDINEVMLEVIYQL
jgi:hypothetical protein